RYIMALAAWRDGNKMSFFLCFVRVDLADRLRDGWLPSQPLPGGEQGGQGELGVRPDFPQGKGGTNGRDVFLVLGREHRQERRVKRESHRVRFREQVDEERHGLLGAWANLAERRCGDVALPLRFFLEPFHQRR